MQEVCGGFCFCSSGWDLILVSYKAYRKKDVLEMVLSLVVIMPTSYPLPLNNIDKPSAPNNPAGVLDTRYFEVQLVNSYPICFHAKVPQDFSIEQKSLSNCHSSLSFRLWSMKCSSFHRSLLAAAAFYNAQCMYSLRIQAVKTDL